MPEDRDRFPAAYEWQKFMNRMTDEQCGRFWKAIYAYQIDGTPYTGDDPIVGISFDAIQPFMDNCRKQYESVCERNRANGKKGGRPRKQKQEENPVGFLGSENGASENPQKPKQNPEQTQAEPKKPDIDIDYDIDIEDIRKKQTKKEIAQDEFAAVMSSFMDNINSDPPPVVVSLIRDFMLSMDGSVIIEAISIAAERNVRNWPYIKSILKKWQDNDVKDMESLNEYRRRKPNGRNDEANRESVSPYSQPQLAGVTVLG